MAAVLVPCTGGSKAHSGETMPDCGLALSHTGADAWTWLQVSSPASGHTGVTYYLRDRHARPNLGFSCLQV